MWQDVRDEDIVAVTEILRRDGGASVVSGGILEDFEREFAELVGGTFGVATNNGTAALYAALWSVGIGPGDEVLVCDYGFHAQAAAVLALGAHVAVFDCESDSLAPSASDAASKRSKRTRAALLHCPWGVPPALDSMRAALPDLPLVLDASHAHGASYGDEGLPAWADVVCYSCGVRKLISGGELGCAVTNDASLRDRMMVLGHVNRVPEALSDSTWRGNAVGLKLRPHGLALALALPQVRRYEEKQRRLATACRTAEAALERHGFLLQAAPGAQRAYWKIHARPPRGEPPFARDRLVDALRNEGVRAAADPYYPSLQGQDLFVWPGHAQRLVPSACPHAAAAAAQGIVLPAPIDIEDAYPAALDTALETVLADAR